MPGQVVFELFGERLADGTFHANVRMNGETLADEDYILRNGTDEELKELYLRVVENQQSNPVFPPEWDDVLTADFVAANPA